ncbi:putative phospholipid scramblase [Lipomyces doorenjongii]|uniref:putative phospholipid scramblase n=1 Tax=Lipomyces doorenjongii TaxID=383834 RepID=UPI0034CFC02C
MLALRSLRSNSYHLLSMWTLATNATRCSKQLFTSPTGAILRASRTYASQEQIDRYTRKTGSLRSRFKRSGLQSYREVVGPEGEVARVIDDPRGIIQRSDLVTPILENPELVIRREIEIIGLAVTLMSRDRVLFGSMEEVDQGFLSFITRQLYRLHRPFTVRAYDVFGNHILTLRRRFSWINSRLQVFLPRNENSEEVLIGESHQRWHPWRRQYNLFLREESFIQFAIINAPFLAYRFDLLNEQSRLLGIVWRQWMGIGTEVFTDVGEYVLSMDSASTAESVADEKVQGMTLDERAVMLATSISIDFDYFSRHSGRGGIIEP